MLEVALIGAGNMGEALLRGWLESGVFEPRQVAVCDRDDRRRHLVSETYGVFQRESNEGAAAEARTVILAVKPQDCEEVLDEISGVLAENSVLLSIVAGLSLRKMREKVGGKPTLVRVMPNMAARVKASVSAYAVDVGRGGFDSDGVRGILGAVGEVVEVHEESMDLVTALSGSGPAYFFLMVEALEEAGAGQGLPRDVSGKLARETFWGAAKLLRETGEEAAALREAVTSPGGTTSAALEEFRKASFGNMIADAVKAARKRAGELAR